MNMQNLWGKIENDLGFNDHNMRRDRPYNGQPHTSMGERGKTEIRGITFRDLRDCYIRAVLLSSFEVSPNGLYQEACKGEQATLCENDLYGWDLNKLDPIAIAQNLSLEVEKLMGIYPNVGRLESSAGNAGVRPVDLPNCMKAENGEQPCSESCGAWQCRGRWKPDCSWRGST